MAIIESSSSNPADLVRKFIVPSVAGVVLYLLVAGLLLILFNAQDIWESLGLSSLSDDSAATLTNLPSVSGFWDSVFNRRIPQIVFWGVIGMVMYAVVWFAWNVLTNLHNDLAADKFVHPRNYDRGKYWITVWGRKSFFAVSASILVIYIFAFFRLLSLVGDLSYAAGN